MSSYFILDQDCSAFLSAKTWRFLCFSYVLYSNSFSFSFLFCNQLPLYFLRRYTPFIYHLLIFIIPISYHGGSGDQHRQRSWKLKERTKSIICAFAITIYNIFVYRHDNSKIAIQVSAHNSTSLWAINQMLKLLFDNAMENMCA